MTGKVYPDKSRWFVKSRTTVGHTYSVVHCDGPTLLWSKDLGEVIYAKEIPRDYWGLKIDDYKNFFEHNIKPKVTFNGYQEKSQSV